MTDLLRSELGRLLARLREQAPIVCAVCGQPSARPMLRGARYCSNACRQKAQYARRKARGTPPPEVPRAAP